MENKINPWLMFWRYPRPATRTVVARSSFGAMLRWFILLPPLMGLVIFLDLNYEKTPYHPFLLALTCLFGSLLSIPLLFIWSFAFKTVGSWFGGKGTYKEVFQGIAFSTYITFVLSLFTTLLYLLGKKLGYSGLINSILNLVLICLYLAGNIYKIVLSFKVQGEAHQFSAWAALGTTLCIGLILIAIFFPIFLVLDFTKIFSI